MTFPLPVQQVYSFITSAYNMRPFYYWFYNSLMIPPSSFQFPLYGRGLPLAVNYGAMGTYISNAFIRPYDEFGACLRCCH